MTPLFDKAKLDPFREAGCEELDSFTLDAHMEHKNRRTRKSRPRLPSSWYIVENELEGIIEENDEQCNEELYSDAQSEYSNEGSQGIDDNE